MFELVDCYPCPYCADDTVLIVGYVSEGLSVLVLFTINVNVEDGLRNTLLSIFLVAVSPESHFEDLKRLI